MIIRIIEFNRPSVLQKAEVKPKFGPNAGHSDLTPFPEDDTGLMVVTILHNNDHGAKPGQGNKFTTA